MLSGCPFLFGNHCHTVISICSSCYPLWDSNTFSGRKEGGMGWGVVLVAATHHNVTVFGGVFCSTIIVSMDVWPQACSVTLLRTMELPTCMGKSWIPLMDGGCLAYSAPWGVACCALGWTCFTGSLMGLWITSLAPCVLVAVLVCWHSK